MYALGSAALAYTMTRDCASGTLLSCGCGTHPDGTDGTFKWSGCDDNVRWGVQFARQFVKPQSTATKRRSAKRLTAASVRPAAVDYGGDADLPAANVNDDAAVREQMAVSAVDQHNYRIGREVSEKSGQFLSCRHAAECYVSVGF